MLDSVAIHWEQRSGDGGGVLITGLSPTREGESIERCIDTLVHIGDI